MNIEEYGDWVRIRIVPYERGGTHSVKHIPYEVLSEKDFEAKPDDLVMVDRVIRGVRQKECGEEVMGIAKRADKYYKIMLSHASKSMVHTDGYSLLEVG